MTLAGVITLGTAIIVGVKEGKKLYDEWTADDPTGPQAETPAQSPAAENASLVVRELHEDGSVGRARMSPAQAEDRLFFLQSNFLRYRQRTAILLAEKARTEEQVSVLVEQLKDLEPSSPVVPAAIGLLAGAAASWAVSGGRR